MSAAVVDARFAGGAIFISVGQLWGRSMVEITIPGANAIPLFAHEARALAEALTKAAGVIGVDAAVELERARLATIAEFRAGVADAGEGVTVAMIGTTARALGVSPSELLAGPADGSPRGVRR